MKTARVSHSFSLLLLVFTTSVSLGLFSLFTQIDSSAPRVEGIQTISKNVSISAFIGDHRFVLFGYTSPFALVTLEGLGIYDQTRADKKGYFVFDNRYSPFSKRETCLTAQDQFGRVSAPSCLPHFPVNYDTNIGPVLLPPTISLDKSHYYAGDEVGVSGQTIPNTDVKLSFFVSQNNSLFENLAQKLNPVKDVYAFTFPDLKTKSDANGSYSLKLPTAKPDVLRLFSQTNYLVQESPQSTDLHIDVLPWWMLIINFLLFIWEQLKPHLLEIVLLAQVGFLLYYFIRQYFFPIDLSRDRALMIREKFALEIEHNELSKR